MSINVSRIFIARLLGLDVFEPSGDRVGRLRDVVVTPFSTNRPPLVVGIVIEVPGRKRIFVPMTKVTSIDQHQIIITGLINLRRFEKRGRETLVVAEFFDREVTLVDGSGTATIEDVAIQRRKEDWYVTQLFVREGNTHSPLRSFRRGQTRVVEWTDAVPSGLEAPQAATQFLDSHADEKPADLAAMLSEMPLKRQLEIARELSDERLADVLQEMAEEQQVLIIGGLETRRVVKVLEEMEPDDAADLVAELPMNQADTLLTLMEPEDAEDVRRLLSYDDDVAGSLMTPVPVVLPPEATVAEALAHIQKEEISPAIASLVCVCRPPLETPTGRFLGVVHFQQLLRRPPHEALGNLVDKNLDPVSDQARISEVVRQLAAYDLVALPVTNSEDRLVGAVTVDDVLDHLLPDDWRESDEETTEFVLDPEQT